MIEVMCVVLMGLNPVLAAMADAPVALVLPGFFNLPLVGQANREDVTGLGGQATVFEAPAEDFGTVGVLAHNYLEGWRFTMLQLGDDVGLRYGDGRLEWYTVREVRAYLSTHPGMTDSTLMRNGQTLTEEQVYREVYGVPGRLVLQTCVGMADGFYFVIAEPNNGFRERIERIEATLPAAGGGAVVEALDLGWVISVSEGDWYDE